MILLRLDLSYSHKTRVACLFDLFCKGKQRKEGALAQRHTRTTALSLLLFVPACLFACLLARVLVLDLVIAQRSLSFRSMQRKAQQPLLLLVI